MWWPFGRRSQPPGNVIQFPAGGRDYLPGGKYVKPEARPADDTLPPAHTPSNPFPEKTYEHAVWEQQNKVDSKKVWTCRPSFDPSFMPVIPNEPPAQLLRRVAAEIDKGATRPTGMFIGTIEGSELDVEALRFYFTGLNRLEVIGLLADLIKELP